MKKSSQVKLLFIFQCILFTCEYSIAQPGEWTWMHGSNTVNTSGNFGTQGVSAPSNVPPPFYEAVEWTDLNNNFWLFGGYSNGTPTGSYGDVWKFDPATNEWTWMHGAGIPGQTPVVGTMGVSSPLNTPGGYAWCGATWVDNNGNFWLFAGSDASGGSFSMMWKYDPLINEWTWMNGPTTQGAIGIFGTQGIPDPANYPPSRWETNATWVDAGNNLWLFGGLGNCGDDLWKYDITSNQWTWMRGTAGFIPPIYGTFNVSAPANTPGSRQVYSKWKDAFGDFWMFGGSGEYNDLWKYTLSTNEWTWVGGPNIPNDPGTYGTACSTATDMPSARHENRACWTDPGGNFWFFGGYEGGVGSTRNDLWKFCPVSGKWTWVNGPASSNGAASYGTLGVSSPSNIPGSRMGSSGWQDATGNFWIFGGYIGVGPTGNDLWRFVPDPTCGDNICSSVPVALFSAPNHICPGTCTDFTNLSLGATTYLWSFTGANPSTSTDVNPLNICYNTPGTYSVQLIATNVTGTDTLTLNNYITVYPYPPPQGIAQSGDTLFANQGAVSYQWYHDGNLIPGATDYFYVALEGGNYNVVCTDPNGCEVEAVIFDVVAGIQLAIGNIQLAIYPNPVIDKFAIGKLQFPINTIRIYNIIGEQVLAVSLPTANCILPTVDCRLFPKGIYWLEVSSREKTLRAKFVKE